jgi:hypothetical protein
MALNNHERPDPFKRHDTRNAEEGTGPSQAQLSAAISPNYWGLIASLQDLDIFIRRVPNYMTVAVYLQNATIFEKAVRTTESHSRKLTLKRFLLKITL